MMMAVFVGCSTPVMPDEPAPAPAEAAESIPALDLPLRLERGSARGQIADTSGWRALQPGEATTGVRRVRAEDGAVFAVGGEPPAGRLWLRGDAEVELGQDADGVVVSAVVGEARLSMFEHGIRVDDVAQDHRDVLLTGADRVVATPTAVHPGWADWTLALAHEPDPAGVGTLEVGSAADVTRLALHRVHVRARTTGDMVEHAVEQVFYNASDVRLEGTFRFPLPEGASLNGLAMEIDGRLMEGELVERVKARETYEAIVDSMQDPALLEWEQGRTFKLRVFPIEARSEKRIIVRYLAPLRRGASGWSFVYGTNVAESQGRIPSFRIDLDGRTVVDQRDFQPGHEVVVPVEAPPSKAMQERRADGTYLAVRVEPDWSALPQGRQPGPRRVVFVLDSSRSALESWSQAMQTLEILLGDLAPQDRARLVACDLACRDQTPDFFTPTEANVGAALSFAQRIDPDGATDLAATFAHVGGIAGGAEVVYIGDGTATWGRTDDAALRDIVKDALGESRLSAAVLGRGASSKLIRDLAAQQGGLVAQPRSPMQVRRFGLAVSGSGQRRTLRGLRIEAEAEAVYPRRASVLPEGETLVALLRVPPGHPLPSSVRLAGFVGDTPIEQTVALGLATPTPNVAHRWAGKHIARMQSDGARREEIVAASIDYGVMSKHTAFLVLESEEAYRRHGIERRRGPGGPEVTGGDLESLGASRVTLNPDRIQPGDPEIRVPAPADARSVVVVFPFGETKVAEYEPDLRAWVVRFLIDKDTPDGIYEVLVRTTHADGTVELLAVDYVVDTHAPLVTVKLRQAGPGSWEISATQVITRHELKVAPESDAEESATRRYAHIASDARRVEVQLPDGRVMRLFRGGGRFTRRWTPETPPTGPVSLRVVASDGAQNRSVATVTVDPFAGGRHAR